MSAVKNPAHPVAAIETADARTASSARETGESQLSGWISSLYRAHCAPLCAYLRRKYGPPPPDPEDIAHQAFTRLSTFSRHQLEEIANPKAFLFRIAENLLLNEKRRNAIRARHKAEAQATFSAHPGFDLDPERVLVTREELALIEAAIRAMPERRRQCFIMHRIDELSFAEIARRLGVSPSAPRAHVERAIADIEAAVQAANQDGGASNE